MRAYQQTGPRRLEQVDIDNPKPADGQVVVKIECGSVCGSDTHVRYQPTLPEEQYPLAAGAPCHEIAGTIVESRNPDHPVGERVIVLPDPSSAGGPGGGLAEYIASGLLISLPEHGSTEEWLMCQPTGTVLYSARRWGQSTDKRIAVIGQGAIGLSFTMIAERTGAKQVIGIDLLDYRLDKASELGATHTINADRENVVEALAEVTNGEGVDVVVDASADPDGLNQAVSLVNMYGTIIGFSQIPRDQLPTFRHPDWMMKEARIIATGSSLSQTPTEAIQTMVDLRDRGWLDPSVLITHHSAWDDIPDAYEMYAGYTDGVIKNVLDISGAAGSGVNA